jgi:hypothetical protein
MPKSQSDCRNSAIVHYSLRKRSDEPVWVGKCKGFYGQDCEFRR